MLASMKHTAVLGRARNSDECRDLRRQGAIQSQTRIVQLGTWIGVYYRSLGSPQRKYLHCHYTGGLRRVWRCGQRSQS